jgi:4-hydroxybenzoate polyprenyltransferase
MNATAEGLNAQPLNRWWTYQRERFPVFAHGPLILAFSFSAVSFSWLLRSESGWPSWRSAVAAFVTCLLFFLQLRLADEFKDFEEDSQFRPYRPVPRGLVTLRELGVLFVIAALVQLAVALWLAPRMVLLLLVPWIYLAGMSREFFAREWLKARPITYLWTHMLIMPLVDFYATGCDWLAHGAVMPRGLFWFLAASFCNGMVIELGRKIRAPDDEEHGVQTYSALWGRRSAIIVWLTMMFLTAICAALAANRINFIPPVLLTLGTLFAVALIAAVSFLKLCSVNERRSDRSTTTDDGDSFSLSPQRGEGRGEGWEQSNAQSQKQSGGLHHPSPSIPLPVKGRGKSSVGAGKRFELLSGLWTLALYLSLGLAPLLWRTIAVAK